MSKALFSGVFPLTVGSATMSAPIFMMSVVPMILGAVLAYAMLLQIFAGGFSHWWMIASAIPPCVVLLARWGAKARKKAKERLDAVWRTGWTFLGFFILFDALASGSEFGLEELYSFLPLQLQGVAFGILGAVFCGQTALYLADEFYPASSDS